MSLGVLLGEYGGFEGHRPANDLESIFYVLLFICSSFHGPALPRKKADLMIYRSFAVNDWFSFPEPRQLALHKCGTLSSTYTFRLRYTQKFAPYFQDLGDCMEQLRAALFPKDPMVVEATYETVLTILRDTFDKLPDPTVEEKPASPPLKKKPTHSPTTPSFSPISTSSRTGPSSGTRSSSSHLTASTSTTVNGSNKRTSTGEDTNPPKRRKSSLKRAQG